MIGAIPSVFELRHRAVGWLVVSLLLACLHPAWAGAEPRLSMKLPAFQAVEFQNGSAVVMPASGHGDVEIWVQDALAEISVASVRVLLNQTPMATFLTVNRLPRGVRVIVKMGASLNPDFAFRSDAENLLTFSASDSSNVNYQAQFYITTNAMAAAPRLADRAPVRPPVQEVSSPARVIPPRVTVLSEWPARTADRVVTLDAEVTDVEGLRRIVIELNGSAIEEVVLENESPVRKQRGFIAKGALPGAVTGNGRKLVIRIPIELSRRVNTVGLRAVSVTGLIGYADRTVELTTIR